MLYCAVRVNVCTYDLYKLILCRLALSYSAIKTLQQMDPLARSRSRPSTSMLVVTPALVGFAPLPNPWFLYSYNVWCAEAADEY